MEWLKRRSEFQAVARGRKIVRPGFVLQALPSGHAGRPPRFGFTVTRKTGNAVIRNRIRRRLREAVRLHAAEAASAGMDYVLIGRRAALTLPFDRLIDDLRSGLAAMQRRDKDAGGKPAT
jgi:ribonuclease P protein component